MLKKLISSCLTIIALFAITSCSGSYKYTASKTIKYKSFLYLTKTLTIKKCNEESCEKPINTQSSASGYIIHLELNGAYMMTAAHVCEEDKETISMIHKSGKKMSAKYFVYRADGKKYRAMVLAFDSKIDACMLYVQSLTTGADSVEVSDIAPTPGDKVFNVAAPYGIWKPGMVPLLEGRYNGEDDFVAMYTLPAAPGSSGSMILNEDGELIGMLHSVFVAFPHISLSVRYIDLKNFINYNLKKYIAYKNVMNALNLKDIFTPYP